MSSSKGVMMLSVTFGISADVIGSALTGGNPVNNVQVALFSTLSGSGKHCDFHHNETIQQKYIFPLPLPQSFWGGSWTLFTVWEWPSPFSSPLLWSAPRWPFSPPTSILLSPYWSLVFMLPEGIKVLWAPSGTSFCSLLMRHLWRRSRPCANRSWPSTAFIPVFFRHHTNGPPPLDCHLFSDRVRQSGGVRPLPCGGGHQCRGPGAVSELHL